VTQARGTTVGVPNTLLASIDTITRRERQSADYVVATNRHATRRSIKQLTRDPVGSVILGERQQQHLSISPIPCHHLNVRLSTDVS
jgi:hypothetical protein